MADMTRIRMSVRGAEVVTVPIDDSLTIAGQAADAYAVGQALSQKANLTDIQARVSVNGQQADNQGLITLYGSQIPMTSTDATTIQAKIAAVDGKTAADIPMSSEESAQSVAAAVAAAGNKTGDDIAVSATDSTTVSDKLDAINTVATGAANRTGATIPYGSGSSTIKTVVDGLSGEMVKSVNGETPDADGDVEITTVALADNLTSETTQTSSGEFIMRTSGGSASIGDGDAWLQRVIGNSRHDGYVARSLTYSTSPMPREESESGFDVASFDEDVFEAYVSGSGTVVLTYSTDWNEDPALYGMTISGTPIAGDIITIVYVKEVRGTIVVATPSEFVSTGWNLYDHANGYARCVRYSETLGYMISGTYTALTYSSDEAGTQDVETITPVSGSFNVPGDGFIHVTGGNGVDTAIWTVWTNWSETPGDNSFEAYTDSRVDLSEIMETCFPWGLCAVGDVRDEINFNLLKTISRVERLAYSAGNLEAAEQSGRAYEYDENYIYLERETKVTEDLDETALYTAADHGLEFFEGTEVEVGCENFYGQNLKDKLRTDVVTISAQTLDSTQQARVRSNIGLGTAAITNVANNLTTTASGSVLDARQGKTLKDSVDSLSDSFTNFSYTALANGTDLNDITNVGFYGTSSSAVTASLEHCPASGSGMSMLVTQRGGNRVQIIFHGSKIYCRTSTSSGWSSWFEFNGTAVS